MVVCKFFLQGTCKFGSYCHNEHQVPSNYNYTNFNENRQPSTSILQQTNFGNVQNAKASTTANVDVNTLVKSVVTDMTGAEKGGQWLLSSYAPFKEKPAFPGFDDQSPEEIRLGFYEAQNNGTMDQYKQQLQMLLQNTLVKVRALQNPSPEVITMLQNIYSSPALSFNGTYGQNTSATSNFSQQSNIQPSNIFANQNKSPFVQGNDAFKSNTQQNTNIFGAAPAKSIFGGSEINKAQTNIFANPALPNHNQNIFMGNNFAGAQTAGFGNQQSSNIFAQSGQALNSNMFGTPNSNIPAFGNPQQSTNMYASPTQTQQQNIFVSHASNQPSVFKQQQNIGVAQNIFTTPSQPLQNIQQNTFSSQIPQQQNMFGVKSNTPLNPTPQQSVASPNYSASIFGSAVNMNPTLSFGSVAEQTVDESLYSKIEELGVEEKKWFENDSLDILTIPDKPPTYDMCFKV